MFGINLKYVYPFVAAMIGSGIASMFNNLMGVRANAIGVGGLPGIFSHQRNRRRRFVSFWDGNADCNSCTVYFNHSFSPSRNLLIKLIQSIVLKTMRMQKDWQQQVQSAGVANTPSQTISKRDYCN